MSQSRKLRVGPIVLVFVLLILPFIVCFSRHEGTVDLEGVPLQELAVFELAHEAIHLKAALSRDGKTLVLAGGDAMEKQICIAPFPPKSASDYSTVIEVNGFYQIPALAISNDATPKVAFVLRGTQERPPLPPSKKTLDFIDQLQLKQGLYVQKTGLSAEKKLLCNLGEVPGADWMNLLDQMSLIWSEDNQSIYFFDGQKNIFRIDSENGDKEIIHKLDDKEKLISPLALTMESDLAFVKLVGRDIYFSIFSVSEKQMRSEKINSLPGGSPDIIDYIKQFGFISIVGNDHLAYIIPFKNGATVKIVHIKTHSEIATYTYYDKGDIWFRYTPYAFTPNDHSIVFSRKIGDSVNFEIPAGLHDSVLGILPLGID